MKGDPLLSAVMTPFPFAVGIGDGVIDARKLMLEHRVHHLPVVKDGELVGLISDRDIKLMLGPEFDYPNPREVTVEEVYVDDCYSVDIHSPLAEVLATMAERHIGAAVVTRHGQLVGIFTAIDACRAFAGWLQQRNPEPPPDRVA